MALLYMSDGTNGGEWRELMCGLIPDLDFRIHPDIGDPADIEMTLIWRYKLNELKSFPNLKLIASLGAGVDHLVGEDRRHLPEGVPIARLVDPSMTTQMTEWCLMAILNHNRRWDAYRKLQAERRYEEIAVRQPGDVTVGVLGLGELGGDCARVLAAVGYRVKGWSRSPKDLDGVACSHGADSLAGFLGDCDIVVCLLPLTPDTTGILNARTFAQMKPGAYVVNAARGGHIVEADLIAAIDAGHIAGATLDVQQAEPMPDDHPFWYHPRIVTFPHVAAITIAESCAPQVAENYRRMKDGRPFLNLVDLDRGY
jgi:phosphoglycerate dehydrogenase-like enzyme